MTKPEPLKGKEFKIKGVIISALDVTRDINKPIETTHKIDYKEERTVFFDSDVKEAVEWLKDKIIDYANNKLGGEVCEVPELKKVYKLIDEAFPDVKEKKNDE